MSDAIKNTDLNEININQIEKENNSQKDNYISDITYDEGSEIICSLLRKLILKFFKGFVVSFLLFIFICFVPLEFYDFIVSIVRAIPFN